MLRANISSREGRYVASAHVWSGVMSEWSPIGTRGWVKVDPLHFLLWEVTCECETS